MIRFQFNRLTSGVAGLALFLVAGCAGILGGESVPIRYYVLSEVPRVEQPRTEASEAIIAVIEVSMSDYLDTTNFVTRTTANTVDLAQFDQWAAPFRQHVSRTLKNNIANRIPSERVLLSPLSIPVTVDYEVRTDIQRFERDPRGDVVLEARWAFVDVSRRTAAVLETVEIRKPVAIDSPADSNDVAGTARETYSAIAAAMSAALGEMSDEMAARIRRDVTGR